MNFKKLIEKKMWIRLSAENVVLLEKEQANYRLLNDTGCVHR